MKPIDAGAQASWNALTFASDVSVMVDSTGAGVFVDLTDWFGENWVLGVDTQESVDEQTAGLVVKLARKISDRDLSPYIQSSLLNIVAGVYVPALASNRIIRILGYVGAPDMDKNSMAAVVMFEGRIDEIDGAADNGNSIELHCRDGACDYQDTWIEASTQYSSGGGVNVDVVMQAIIDGWISQFINTKTLYVPSTALFTILPYVQDKMSVMDALKRLADLIGWDLRWKYRSSSNRFELTFIQPDRALAVPAVWTFTVDSKYSVNRLASDRTNVRNRVRVVFTDSATGVVSSVLVTDSASIAKYGPRYMELVEDGTQGIDTVTEATNMANAILPDVMEPLAEYELDVPFHPWIELNDRVNVQAAVEDNDVADFTLTLAVTTIKHSITDDGSFSTTLGLRGKPSAGFTKWLRLAAAPGVGAAWQDRTLGTPANVLALQTLGGIDVTFDAPTDANWAISRVFVSTSSGFTPDTTNLAAEGRTNKFKIGSLVPGVTYYVKIIHFGLDGSRSAVSTQVIVAAALVGVAFMNLACEPGQVLPNGDFNCWTPPTDNTTGPPDNWTVIQSVSGVITVNAALWTSGAAPAVYAIAGDQTGSWVLRFSSPAGTTKPGIRNTTLIPVTPGVIYAFESSAKSVSGNPAYNALVDWYAADMTTLVGSSSDVAGPIVTTGYTRTTKYLTAPAGCSFIRITVKADPTTAAQFLVDYVKVRRWKAGFELNTVNTGLIGQIAGTTKKPVDFSVTQFDFGSCTTRGNIIGSYFQVPEDGRYQFDALVTMTGTTTGATTACTFETSPDTTTWTAVRDGPVTAQVAGAQIGVTAACALDLTAGTYIRVVISKSDAGNSTISNSALRGFFKGSRIDGGGGG